jgi:hypothetical protein
VKLPFGEQNTRRKSRTVAGKLLHSKWDLSKDQVSIWPYLVRATYDDPQICQPYI